MPQLVLRRFEEEGRYGSTRKERRGRQLRLAPLGEERRH
jgi:hypothetical protein